MAEAQRSVRPKHGRAVLAFGCGGHTHLKFHGTVGPALFNVTTGRFVLDPETGEPVKADPATGKAKVPTEKCPTCGGTVKKARSSEMKPERGP